MSRSVVRPLIASFAATIACDAQSAPATDPDFIELERALDAGSSSQIAERDVEHEHGAQGRSIGLDFVEAGVGGYDVNSTSVTGSSERADALYIGRLAGGLSYEFPSGYALDGGFDYSLHAFDSSTVHNDSELDAHLGMSRAAGAGTLELALRGELFYIGSGDYRHDYGLSLDWQRPVDARNEITLGTFVWRRQYPTGRLRDRSRSIAEASAEWVHSFAEGGPSLSFGILGAYQYATRRPDGASAFYSAWIGNEWPFNARLRAQVLAIWEHNRFNTDQIHFHPDSLDEAYILRRRDNLYELDAGLTWELATSWTLRPRVIYLHDRSTLDDFHYGSTEYWVSVRKSFAAE